MKKDVKALDAKIRKSITYRRNAEIEIKKIMEYDPYLSLGALEKRSGYSRQTIASAYLRIRKSSEWKIWKNNYANRPIIKANYKMSTEIKKNLPVPNG